VDRKLAESLLQARVKLANMHMSSVLDLLSKSTADIARVVKSKAWKLKN
jgi:hypothetical protein